MERQDKKQRVPKAKIAVALQDEFGRVPTKEEIDHVFHLTRVMYTAILGLHYKRNDAQISLPSHVREILESWAVDELGETPAAVFEALADELCSNEELRTFVAELLRDA
jgi:hypothetical protein